MEMEVTMIVVFGTNEEINVQWFQHNFDKIPHDMEVICVENYDVLCVQTANWIRYACMSRQTWRSIVLVEELARGAKLLHGTALDIAMQYVTTPYVLTVDSDFIIHNEHLFTDILRAAKEHNAVIVGNLLKCAYPYVHPSCALYSTEIARKYKFQRRELEDGHKYLMQFYDSEGARIDNYNDDRTQYADVGAFIYYEAVRNNMPVVANFPVDNYGTHLWARTPHIIHYAPNKIHPHVRFALPDGSIVVFHDFC